MGRVSRSSGPIAHYNCEWNASRCKQSVHSTGKVTPELRSILVRELRQLGVQPKRREKTYFTVWESTGLVGRWRGLITHIAIGSDIELCEVVAVVDQNAPVTVSGNCP